MKDLIDQSLQVGTVVKFEASNIQGIGIILGQSKISKYYLVHYKNYPSLTYKLSGSNRAYITQDEITEVCDTGARVCNITSKPMNEGYLWEGGILYCKEDKDCADEIRREIREDIAWADEDKVSYEGKEFSKEDLINMDDIKLIDIYYEISEEVGFEFYYTDWDLEDAVENGDGWFVLDGETENIFDIFNYAEVRQGLIAAKHEPNGYSFIK